jgi:hypothetical protein
MKKFLCHLLFLTVAFGFSQEEAITTPQIAIKIALGETVVLEGVSIEFVEVLEDSRCPTDVVCVWEGQARVKLVITGTPTLNTEFEVIVGKKDKNLISSYQGSTIKAVALTPYPTTKNMGERDYFLMVVREKDDQ